MSLIEAIVLGLVQGLTEFIPVSSSGHLLLLHELFGNAENSLGFDVALHVGTLAALVVYFYRDLWRLLTNIFAKNSDGRMARLLIAATIPAAIAGFLFSDYIDEHVRSPLVVAIMLAGVGVVMLVADKVGSRQYDDVSNKNGLIIGFAQILALIPGVSRSGATMTAGLFLGLKREIAARFSFLLAIPIIAGSALGLLLKGDLATNGQGVYLAVGMVTAFASGLFAIKFMLGIISKVGLKPFAIYRIVLALAVLAFLV